MKLRNISFISLNDQIITELSKIRNILKSEYLQSTKININIDCNTILFKTNVDHNISDIGEYLLDNGIIFENITEKINV